MLADPFGRRLIFRSYFEPIEVFTGCGEHRLSRLARRNFSSSGESRGLIKRTGQNRPFFPRVVQRELQYSRPLFAWVSSRSSVNRVSSCVILIAARDHE